MKFVVSFRGVGNETVIIATRRVFEEERNKNRREQWSFSRRLYFRVLALTTSRFELGEIIISAAILQRR